MSFPPLEQDPCDWPFLLTGTGHIAKSGIFENNGLTMGEQKNAIEKFYTLLLTEFRDMASST